MGRTLMEKGGTEKNYHQDSTQHNLINRKWSFKEVERSLANIGWVLSLMANKSCQANTERASCKTIDHTVSLYQYLASYILFNYIYVTEGKLLSQCVTMSVIYRTALAMAKTSKWMQERESKSSLLSSVTSSVDNYITKMTWVKNHTHYHIVAHSW